MTYPELEPGGGPAVSFGRRRRDRSGGSSQHISSGVCHRKIMAQRRRERGGKAALHQSQPFTGVTQALGDVALFELDPLFGR